jgi:proteasome lid subunit RPN8/RPN11
MKTNCPFQFQVALRKRDGSALAQSPATPDLEPMVECARLRAHRRLRLDSLPAGARADVRPVWQDTLGQPWVKAVEICLRIPNVGEVVAHAPTTCFKRAATDASHALVERGLLESGERFSYLVAAYPVADVAPEPAPRRRLEIEEVPVPLRCRPSRLADFLAQSVPCGEHDGEDIHVFIPRSILDEAEEMTRAADGVETASVLIGHLHRDPAGGEIFLEATAHIPARNPQATSTKVTLGPETWDSMHAAVKLRGAGEQMIGWFHSHPAARWCNAQCPPASRAECPLQRVFFSADDCDVQRAVFSKAFHVALLVTQTDAGMRHALFGWRDGVIVQRGFHITGHEPNQPAAPAPFAAATIGDPEHEKPCPD